MAVPLMLYTYLVAEGEGVPGIHEENVTIKGEYLREALGRAETDAGWGPQVSGKIRLLKKQGEKIPLLEIWGYAGGNERQGMPGKVGQDSGKPTESGEKNNMGNTQKN
jgi:hypothetical protein